MPNASWIAKLISLSELAVGVGLVLGLFTGIAAFAAVALNFTYMMTGTGVNPLRVAVWALSWPGGTPARSASTVSCCGRWGHRSTSGHWSAGS